MESLYFPHDYTWTPQIPLEDNTYLEAPYQSDSYLSNFTSTSGNHEYPVLYDSLYTPTSCTEYDDVRSDSATSLQTSSSQFSTPETPAYTAPIPYEHSYFQQFPWPQCTQPFCETMPTGSMEVQTANLFIDEQTIDQNYIDTFPLVDVVTPSTEPQPFHDYVHKQSDFDTGDIMIGINGVDGGGLIHNALSMSQFWSESHLSSQEPGHNWDHSYVDTMLNPPVKNRAGKTIASKMMRATANSSNGLISYARTIPHPDHSYLDDPDLACLSVQAMLDMDGAGRASDVSTTTLEEIQIMWDLVGDDKAVSLEELMTDPDLFQHAGDFAAAPMNILPSSPATPSPPPPPPPPATSPFPLLLPSQRLMPQPLDDYIEASQEGSSNGSANALAILRERLTRPASCSGQMDDSLATKYGDGENVMTSKCQNRDMRKSQNIAGLRAIKRKIRKPRVRKTASKTKLPIINAHIYGPVRVKNNKQRQKTELSNAPVHNITVHNEQAISLYNSVVNSLLAQQKCASLKILDPEMLQMAQDIIAHDHNYATLSQSSQRSSSCAPSSKLQQVPTIQPPKPAQLNALLPKGRIRKSSKVTSAQQQPTPIVEKDPLKVLINILDNRIIRNAPPKHKYEIDKRTGSHLIHLVHWEADGETDRNCTKEEKEVKLECLKCLKTFDTCKELARHNLVMHETIFSEKQPDRFRAAFKCSQCSHVFGRRVQLSNHMKRVHSGTPQFLCHYCSAGYNCSNTLKKHMVSVHWTKNR